MNMMGPNFHTRYHPWVEEDRTIKMLGLAIFDYIFLVVEFDEV
jgi:hypothetical protein